jgi:hypothetical protein
VPRGDITYRVERPLACASNAIVAKKTYVAAVKVDLDGDDPIGRVVESENRMMVDPARLQPLFLGNDLAVRH